MLSFMLQFCMKLICVFCQQPVCTQVSSQASLFTTQLTNSCLISYCETFNVNMLFYVSTVAAGDANKPVSDDVADERDVFIKKTGNGSQHPSVPLSADDAADADQNHDIDRTTPVKRRSQSESRVDGGDEQNEGSVSHRTYRAYVGAAGGATAVVCVILASMVAEGVRAFSYWWLAHWLEQGSGVNTILHDWNFYVRSDIFSKVDVDRAARKWRILGEFRLKSIPSISVTFYRILLSMHTFLRARKALEDLVLCGTSTQTFQFF